MKYTISKSEADALLYTYYQVLSSLDDPKVKGLIRKSCLNFKKNLFKTADEIRKLNINDFISISKEV